MSVAEEMPAKNTNPAEEVLYAVAGVADVVLDWVESMARQARATLAHLQRADLGDLVREGHDDLKARGELTLRRHMPEPHLEVLAQRAAAERHIPGNA